jgi:hypothetical protein
VSVSSGRTHRKITYQEGKAIRNEMYASADEALEAAGRRE